MKIMIGANIKRLRTEKGVTQEQLAEAMNVSCAAVSKWERAETYPDISLLQPLAFYFGVSLDTLMGYDREKYEKEIDGILLEFRTKRDRRIIEKAYREYPNDYRIMYSYMWTLGVQDAEPDLDLARKHKDEIGKICDKILEGCIDIGICTGAWKMKAILLHAEGKTDEALQIHRENAVSWYQTFEQLNEQLFTKDRPEFLYWVSRNMYELVDFGADKLVKSKFYDRDIPYNEMVSTLEKIGDGLYKLGCELDEAYLIAQAETIFGRLRNDLIAREFRGATDGDIIRITDKNLAAAEKLTALSKTDKPCFDALVKIHNVSDLLDFTLNSALSWQNPRNVKLLENDAYRAVIEKYR
ncbi:MAG: helix-turn-helix transcriptional regulator [Clostridia bacterium]|nr:helix-turn-helix transcriptional regulator [Clostridia bacterium]